MILIRDNIEKSNPVHNIEYEEYAGEEDEEHEIHPRCSQFLSVGLNNTLYSTKVIVNYNNHSLHLILQ